MRFFIIFLLSAFLIFGGVVFADTVSTPSLSITAPAAGVQLSANSQVNVTWSLTNAPQGAEVRYLLQLPKDNTGGVISRIVITPSYAWTIPAALPSGNYTILLKALVQSSNSRIYQGSVNIVVGSASPQATVNTGSTSGAPPSLSILTPADSGRLSANSQVNVTWSLTNAPQGAEVRYLAQFPRDNREGVISRVLTTPSYTWTVPTTLPSANYTILVKAQVRADGRTRVYQSEKVVSVEGSAAAPGAGSGSGSSVTGPRVWLNKLTNSRYEIRAASMSDLYGWQIDVAFNDSYFNFVPGSGFVDSSLFGASAFPVPVVAGDVRGVTVPGTGSTKVFTVGATNTPPGEAVDVNESSVLLGTLNFEIKNAGGEVKLIRPHFLHSNTAEFVVQISSQ